MRIHAAVALVGACLHAVLAAAEPRARTDAALRLVKTSEGDPGQWVTEKQMFERFVSRKVGFLDITDRPEVWALLFRPPLGCSGTDALLTAREATARLAPDDVVSSTGPAQGHGREAHLRGQRCEAAGLAADAHKVSIRAL